MDTRVVQVTISAGDDERTDEATRGLLTDLREFPEVRLVARAGDGPAPAGARGGDLVTLGGLLVTIFGQPEALRAVVNFVAERVTRRGGRVEVRVDGQVLKLDNATEQQRDAIVDAFVRKVLGPDS